MQHYFYFNLFENLAEHNPSSKVGHKNFSSSGFGVKIPLKLALSIFITLLTHSIFLYLVLLGSCLKLQKKSVHEAPSAKIQNFPSSEIFGFTVHAFNFSPRGPKNLYFELNFCVVYFLCALKGSTEILPCFGKVEVFIIKLMHYA